MKKKSKVLKIIANVILYFFVAVGLFSVIMTIFSKQDVDGAVKILGKEFRIVQTASMEKNENTDVSDYKIKDISVGSMIIVDTVPTEQEKAQSWYGDLKIGDVLTFRYYIAGTQYTITHRIIKIDKNSGEGYTIRLKGDNVGSEDAEPGGIIVQEIDTSAVGSFNFIIGKVTGQSKLFGFIISSLKKPIVLALIIIVPCVIIIIFEIFKIVTLLRGDKKKEREEEKKKQTDEIEELKKQLAALKEANGGVKTDDKNSTTAGE